MNGLLTKLNIIKNNTLVKRGQLLYNSGTNLNVGDSGDSLPVGPYLVKSVQLVREGSESGKKQYLHSLELVGVNCDGENKLSLNDNVYRVKVSAKDFDESFGISKKAKKGIIYEYIKDQFDKSRKEGFDPKIDYDSILSSYIYKVMRKSPISVGDEDAEDIIIDVIMKSITPKVVKNYDNKHDLLKYLGTIVYYRAISYMKDWVKKKNREKLQEEDDSDREDKRITEEEMLEQKRFEKDTNDTTMESDINYRDLIKDLTKFMKSRLRGDKQLKVFEDMLQGYSSSEIAEKNNVSPSLISRYTNDIRESLKQYAEKTNNNALLTLMSKHSKKRMHSDEDVSVIYNVLQEYKKKFGVSTESRKPAGEVNKVRRTVIKDRVSDEAITKAILSDSHSSKKLKKELGEYFELLDEQDELIESEGGKIVGLKIVSDEVRNVSDKAKCKKKKESKTKGFFVYSKSNLGPHKVLKSDGTFSIKLNKKVPVKIFKSKVQAEKATSRYQHTKLNLGIGIYPEEYLKDF